jgi:hypothetical protein
MEFLSAAQAVLAMMWGQRPNGGGPYPIFGEPRLARVRGSFCCHSDEICAYRFINVLQMAA